VKKSLTLALALVALATVGVLTFERNAAAQKPLQDYRAGTAGFAIGQAGINITFSSPMPSTDYAVSVQATNTAGYSPTSDCTYFNPLHKRTDGFEVQHKRCDDGVPVTLDVNVSLDWIVVAKK
jgi:hypothetical protein